MYDNATDMKEQEKKRLFVDMDGVLVDFASGIARLSPETREAYADNPEEAPGIFSLMDPLPGAIEAVTRLTGEFEVYILSTAPWKNPSGWADKVRWVQKYLGEPFKKRLILCHCKDFLRGDFLIDDRPWKHGADRFVGTLIHFGSPTFPDWPAVEKFLRSPEAGVTKP